MRQRLGILAVALPLAVASCSSGTTDQESFTLTEFSIEGPSSLDSGIDAISTTNRGEFPHTLVVTASSGEVVAATGLIQPGEKVSLDLSLGVGDYLFTCRIVTEIDDGSIVDHYESGMTRTVQVVG